MFLDILESKIENKKILKGKCEDGKMWSKIYEKKPMCPQKCI